MLEPILAGARRRADVLASESRAVRARAVKAPARRDFAGSLAAPGLSVIAEVKRRSPSRGDIAPGLDPVALAHRYASGGAAALSVLTEPDHFGGSNADLEAVRAAVPLPVLRKDFIVHPVQVWEARAIGADAILLIVAALDDRSLALLLAEAEEAGVAALVEVHDETEAKRALALGAELVGVNNRDLSTFAVDLAIAEKLAPRLGDAVVKVAESGIHTPGDAARMAAAGYQAVLVGESAVRAADAATLVASLRRAAG